MKAGESKSGGAGFKRGAAVSSLAVAAALVAGGTARAQTPAPVSELAAQAAPAAASSQTTPEDIIVTARFRAENVQSTPISVTALSGAQLEARGFSNILNVTQTAPNVSLSTGRSTEGKSAIAFIRGVGQGDYSYAFEPAVGFYLDDVYIGTVFGSALDLLDVDHVEVLRGPQGTLFGRNSEGGAVRIFTRKPSGDNSGYIEAGYGSYDRVRVRGAIDVGIVPDKLALRVSGGVNRADGFMKVYDFACANPSQAGTLPVKSSKKNCRNGTLGGEDSQNVRGVLRWTPTPDIKVDVAGDYLNDDGQIAAERTIVVGNPSPGPFAAYSDRFRATFGIPIDGRFVSPGKYSTYFTNTNLFSGRSIKNANTVEAWSGSLSFYWDIDPDTKLKSITAYRGYNGYIGSNFGNTPATIALTSLKVRNHQFTQETSLTHDFHLGDTTHFELAGGVFYYKAYSHLGGFLDNPEFGLSFTNDDPVNTRNISGFAHGLLVFNDKLNLEAGFRYTSEKKSYQFNHVLLDPSGPLPAGADFLVAPTAYSRTKRPDYRIGANYQAMPQLLLYANYSTGFKTGGINPRPSTPADVIPFGAEKLEAYEAGVKSQLLDRRLQTNVAIFQSNYSDLQLQTIGPPRGGLPNLQTVNVGKARIKGVELEVVARPVDNLSIDGSLGYLHYRNRDLGAALGVAGGPALDSKPLLTPTWKYSIGGQYSIALNDDAKLTPRLDFTHQSKVYSDADNTDLGAIKGYGVLNGRLELALAAPRLSVAFEAKNLTKTYYYTYKFNSLSGQGAVTGLVGRPREFLLTVRHQFGGSK